MELILNKYIRIFLNKIDALCSRELISVMAEIMEIVCHPRKTPCTPLDLAPLCSQWLDINICREMFLSIAYSF